MFMVVLMSSYVGWVHATRTIPSIRNDKRAQMLVQFAEERRAAEQLEGTEPARATT